MLHALGITHVVSVGECALIPPENGHNGRSGEYATAKPGSLWIEEREGRIKVLDIKGVCDDGIDSLEPQLPPICEWIDEARRSGGKVLVHCRVGVSRSATVTVSLLIRRLGDSVGLSFVFLFHWLDRLRDETSRYPARRRISHCALSPTFSPHSTQHAFIVQFARLGSQTRTGTRWSRRGPAARRAGSVS